MALSNEERLGLIKENLAEVLNPEIIEGILAEGRSPKIYWGMFNPPLRAGANEARLLTLVPKALQPPADLTVVTSSPLSRLRSTLLPAAKSPSSSPISMAFSTT